MPPPTPKVNAPGLSKPVMFEPMPLNPPTLFRKSSLAIRMPAAKVGWTLFKRSLGFRTLLDVIPLDASLVRGSHGRQDRSDDDGPMVMSRESQLFSGPLLASIDVFNLILGHLRS